MRNVDALMVCWKYVMFCYGRAMPQQGKVSIILFFVKSNQLNFTRRWKDSRYYAFYSWSFLTLGKHFLTLGKIFRSIVISSICCRRDTGRTIGTVRTLYYEGCSSTLRQGDCSIHDICWIMLHVWTWKDSMVVLLSIWLSKYLKGKTGTHFFL